MHLLSVCVCVCVCVRAHTHTRARVRSVYVYVPLVFARCGQENASFQKRVQQTFHPEKKQKGPHVCAQCDQNCPSASHLTQHALGEKPFVCAACDT